MGIYKFVNKARGGESPKNFNAHIAMSQQCETEIPQLWIKDMGFTESSISSLSKS